MTTEAETQSVTAEQIKDLAHTMIDYYADWSRTCAENDADLASRAETDLHTAIDAIAAERDALKARCGALETRLELDVVYKVVDGAFVSVPIPPEDRHKYPDAISCRDATIQLQDETIDKLKTELAEMMPKGCNAERLKIAKETLKFLNAKTGRNYRFVHANINPICARLKEGATEVELRQVVAKKAREWGGDEVMEKYLRPATLFNATKFAQYQGDLV